MAPSLEKKLEKLTQMVLLFNNPVFHPELDRGFCADAAVVTKRPILIEGYVRHVYDTLHIPTEDGEEIIINKYSDFYYYGGLFWADIEIISRHQYEIIKEGPYAYDKPNPMYADISQMHKMFLRNEKDYGNGFRVIYPNSY